MLVGFAKDIHKLNKDKNKNLILGGYLINNEKYKIKSHSDGDIILHTIADAIYSNISNKDIGEYFSDQDINNKNLDSKKILNHALELFKKSDFNKINNINLTIVCNHILINKYKENIINSLELLIPNTKINLKAKRFEKKSSMIECYCILLIN